MTAPTHVSFAEFIYLLILTTTGVPLSVLNASVIALSSILPDIDTAASTVGRLVPFISIPLERRFGHRTLTHSMCCMVVLALCALPLLMLSSPLYVCFIVGYASHPLLDTMTINGVKLFYPFSSVKCVFPFEVNNPQRYRAQTGSGMDKTLAIIFLVACVPTFVVAYVGYERFVRTTQHNIEAAVRDYGEFSKDHLVFARIEAYSSLTKQPLSGTFEIIGALNPTTLVCKGADGRPHTIGKEFQADYVVENILCTQGVPARSAIRNIDMSNQLLSQVASYVDSSAENYFYGDLATSDIVSLPENIRIFTPVTGGGNTIKLNLATYEDIRTFNLEYVFITKGLLTIKSISTHDIDNGGAGSDLLPRLENFAQISISLDAKESIECSKQEGDTVQEKELIARKDLARSYEDQISLNQEAIADLVNRASAFGQDIGDKISISEQAIRFDSAECENDVELSRNHFVADAIPGAARLKLKKELQLLEALQSTRDNFERKTSLAIHKLEIDIAELQNKARSASLQSEVRSNVRGVLADIRKSVQSEKTRITFIIRRIP